MDQHLFYGLLVEVPRFFLGAATASLGALVGAVVGAGGAWLVYRNQRTDQRTTRLNAALGRVIEKLNDDVAAIDDYVASVEQVFMEGYTGPPDDVFEVEWKRHGPNLATTRGLIYAARLETDGEEGAAVAALLPMVTSAQTLYPEHQQDLLEDMLNLIWSWRAGDIETARVPAVAEDMSRRRRAAQDALK